MTEDLRCLELERQLIATRAAAVKMMLGMAEAIVTTPEGREELARGFEEAAETGDGEAARLALLVAKALRR